MLGLKIHPELGIGGKSGGELHRHFGRRRRAAVNDGGDVLARDAQRRGYPGYRHPQGLQVHLKQNLARMRGSVHRQLSGSRHHPPLYARCCHTLGSRRAWNTASTTIRRDSARKNTE